MAGRKRKHDACRAMLEGRVSDRTLKKTIKDRNVRQTQPSGTNYEP